MLKYLNLICKLVWFQYFDRESIDISSNFGVLSILAILDIYFSLFVYIFKYFRQLKSILYTLDVFSIH